jgi:hypothetical protein
MDDLEALRLSFPVSAAMLRAASEHARLKVKKHTGISGTAEVSKGWEWATRVCEKAVESWEPRAWRESEWEWARGVLGVAENWLPFTGDGFLIATEIGLWQPQYNVDVEDATNLHRVVYAHLDEAGAHLAHAIGRGMADAWKNEYGKWESMRKEPGQ